MSPAIVTAIDEGTDPAVARIGAELARELRSTLVLAHVVDDPPLGESSVQRERDRHAAVRRGRENLRWVRTELPAGIEVRERVLLGSPVEELIAIVGAEQAQLLVVGARGRGALATAFFGSVSRALTREAPCPIVILTPGAVRHPRPELADVGSPEDREHRSSVVVGVDGSDRSLDAARLAADLARRLRTRLILVHALDAPAGVLGPTEMEAADMAIRILTSIDSEGKVRVEWGPASQALESVAAEEGARLVVIGARDMGALRAAALGSVTAELVRTSRTPLVVLPERARAASGSRRGGGKHAA